MTLLFSEDFEVWLSTKADTELMKYQMENGSASVALYLEKEEAEILNVLYDQNTEVL